MLRHIILIIKRSDQLLVGLTMKLVRLRYGTSENIHPKHLFDMDRNSFLKKVLVNSDIKGFTFLDLGSGAGSDLLLAGVNGAKKVVGVEYNDRSRLISIKRLSDINLSFEVFNFDLENASMPFRDGSFDIINFTNVLEHLHNRKAVLDEVARIVSDSGKIIISIPNKNTPWKKMQRKYGVDSRDDDDHKIEYSKELINCELNAAGLEIVTPMEVIVPSLPIHGVLSMLCLIGPKPYLAGQRFKRYFVSKHPQHTIGWIFIAKKISHNCETKM